MPQLFLSRPSALSSAPVSVDQPAPQSMAVMEPINNALSILCMRDLRSIRHTFDDLKAPDRPNPGIGEPGHIRCVADNFPPGRGVHHDVHEPVGVSRPSDSWRDRADQLVRDEPPIHRGGHPVRGMRHSIEDLVSAEPQLEHKPIGPHRLA